MSDHLTRLSYLFSAFITGLSVVSINTIALIIGILLGLATFIVTWVYKHKECQHNLQFQSEMLKVAKSSKHGDPRGS